MGRSEYWYLKNFRKGEAFALTYVKPNFSMRPAPNLRSVSRYRQCPKGVSVKKRAAIAGDMRTALLIRAKLYQVRPLWPPFLPPTARLVLGSFSYPIHPPPWQSSSPGRRCQSTFGLALLALGPFRHGAFPGGFRHKSYSANLYTWSRGEGTFDARAFPA